MRKLFYHWLISLGMLGLVIMLASCGGSSTGSTTGTPGNGSSSPTTSTGNTPTGNSTSTISFTSSGGLSGSYTFKIPILVNSNQLLTTSKNKKLTIGALDNGVGIDIIVLPYTGPGSYTLSNKYSPDNSQSETMDIQKDKKVWGGYIRLSPSWSCPLTIASDTAATINANGQQYTNFREIKGSFSCSQVLSALNTDPPVNLSNGQLDVFVQTVTGS